MKFILLITCLLCAAPALSQETPQSVIDEFLTANRHDDIDTMLILATPDLEPNIQSAKWRNLWRAFSINTYLEVRYQDVPRYDQAAEAIVLLEYSDELIDKLRVRYEAMPPGPDKERYRLTIEKRGRREASIRTVRIRDTWYWNQD